MRILYDGEAGGQGGGGGAGSGGAAGGDWRASLPEDLKAHPALASFKDVAGLAKSHVHAQSMLGVEKLSKPLPTWKPEQWNEFYSTLGRPESPDKYSFKVDAAKLPQGFNIDDSKLADARKSLHEAGLTDKQANSVLQYYLDSTTKSFTEGSKAKETARESAIVTLRQEFGDKFEHKVNVAKSVVQKFGSESLRSKLDEIGNDPDFIKLFSSIGEAMLDDTAGERGPGLIVGDASQAIAEIGQLKIDSDFQKALNTREHPGHNAAVERWSALHTKAYPNTPGT